MSKLPYDDEQLSRILSAKAGRQLVTYGQNWKFTDAPSGGCINQVAFVQPNSSIAYDEYGNKVTNIAEAFDRVGLGVIKKMSAERFLRWLEKAAEDPEDL